MMLSGSGGGGRREGDAGDKLGRGQDKQAGRERELESKLAEAAAREHKLRTQLARLEHIQKAAQGTALAQEQQLHRAVHAMGRTSDTLDAATAGLSLEIEQWRGKAEAAAKEAGRHKAKADEAMAQLAQYDSAVATLEKELKECKDTLHLYHDRIVALAGPEDKAVEGHSKWADKHKSGMLPLSSHLKATNKLGQEYAAEKRHLERSIAISAKALDAARAELAQAQALRAQENHEWQLRVREQATALQDLEHRLRTQRDDGQLRVQELQRSVRLLGAKSDTHKTIASLTQEVAALRTAEQRLSNDAEFFRARAGELDGIPMWARRAGGDGRCASSLSPWMYTHTHTHTHTGECQEAMKRVVSLQCRLNSVQYAPGNGSEQLVTTMSEQIEHQEAEVSASAAAAALSLARALFLSLSCINLPLHACMHVWCVRDSIHVSMYLLHPLRVSVCEVYVSLCIHASGACVRVLASPCVCSLVYRSFICIYTYTGRTA